MPRGRRRRPGKRLRFDLKLQEELDYAAPRGIPHSIFLGRPQPQPGEPYWLPEDVDKALAWQRDQNARCKDCRTRRDEWWDERGFPLARPKWKVISRRCPACEKVELHDMKEAEAAQQKSGGGDQSSIRRLKAGLKTVFAPADAD